MALRSAKNAGLDVPEKSIKKAVTFIKRCYNQRHGAYGYQPGSHPTYAMAAAGVMSMQVCGQHDSAQVKTATDWLLHRARVNQNHHWFFYCTYYYAQGMYQRGGEHAKAARRRVGKVLLQFQADDGSWSGTSGQERHAGRVYATSLAILSLSVKHHYLPIYQR